MPPAKYLNDSSIALTATAFLKLLLGTGEGGHVLNSMFRRCSVISITLLNFFLTHTSSLHCLLLIASNGHFKVPRQENHLCSKSIRIFLGPLISSNRA